MKYHRRGTAGQPSLFPRIFFLALFFSVGILAGYFFATRLSDSTIQELSDYFRQYLLLESNSFERTVASTIVLYIRYPLTVVLLGFSSAGTILIPCLAVAFGAFTSFSVSCFVTAFGTSGIWLALAALGFRCAVTLPCFLVLAEPAWGNATNLATLSFGRGRRVAKFTCGRSFWKRSVICLTVLLLGVCVDLILVPRWLQHTLNRILIYF